MAAFISCTRRLRFEAGHRVAGHENKCANLHGHSYEVLITAQAEQLDAVGRVIDFGVLKARIGTWIDEKLDHGFLLSAHDFEAIEAVSKVRPHGGDQKLYLMQENPTAENIAKLLLNASVTMLEGTGVQVVEVTVHETANCYATVRRKD